MLTVENISFERYFEPVFRPVSFKMVKGKLLLVTGANGCGKTTLIRVLADVLTPTEGFIDNQASGVSYVGHYLGIKDDLSVYENLRFAREFLGGVNRSCEEAIHEIGLDRVAGQLARSLSAGQRKRCALARLLLSDTELWLLDEPYSNLDDEGVRVVDDILTRHLEGGGACVLATHGAHRPRWHNTQNYHLVSGAA